MFENLTHRLDKTFRHLIGRGKFTDDNMKQTLTEVKHALIEADVALEVVKTFIEDVRQKAKGIEIGKVAVIKKNFKKTRTQGEWKPCVFWWSR